MSEEFCQEKNDYEYIYIRMIMRDMMMMENRKRGREREGVVHNSRDMTKRKICLDYLWISSVRNEREEKRESKKSNDDFNEDHADYDCHDHSLLVLVKFEKSSLKNNT